jgi:small subunit ribosomal protein S4e
MKNHLKRLNMPRTWKLLRKESKYVIRPNAGKTMDLSMPLLPVLRDMLKVCSSAKEARYAINQKLVNINHKPAKMPEQTLGLFDVLSFGGKHYNLQINERNQLVLVEISEAESKTIKTKITNKTTLKGGKVQLGLLNGYNFLVPKDDYKVGDTVVIEIPKYAVKEKKELKKGSEALIFRGKHPATTGKVEEIKDGLITINTGKHKISTLEEYAIAQ